MSDKNADYWRGWQDAEYSHKAKERRRLKDAASRTPRCPDCLTANPQWVELTVRNGARCKAHQQARARWRDRTHRRRLRGRETAPYDPPALPQPDDWKPGPHVLDSDTITALQRLTERAVQARADHAQAVATNDTANLAATRDRLNQIADLVLALLRRITSPD